MDWAQRADAHKAFKDINFVIETDRLSRSSEKVSQNYVLFCFCFSKSYKLLICDCLKILIELCNLPVYILLEILKSMMRGTSETYGLDKLNS